MRYSGQPHLFAHSNIADQLRVAFQNYRPEPLPEFTNIDAKLNFLRTCSVNIKQKEANLVKQLAEHINSDQTEEIIKRVNGVLPQPVALEHRSTGKTREFLSQLTSYIFDKYKVAYSEQGLNGENTFMYQKALKLLALAGHAHAATLLGDYHANKQGQSALAGYFYLIGYVMPTPLDSVNGVRGAALMLKADPDQANHQAAIQVLENIVKHANNPHTQYEMQALDLLVKHFLDCSAKRLADQPLALTDQPSCQALVSAVCGNVSRRNELTDLGLALYYLQTYHHDNTLEQVTNILQHHYVGAESDWTRSGGWQFAQNPQLEGMLCKLQLAINPNAINTVSERQESIQQRLDELEGQQASLKLV